MSHRLDFRHLTRPDVLAKIEPQRLRGFLRQVGGSYVADSIDLSRDPLPLTEVAALLGTPGEGYPDSLVDALYHAVDFGKDSNAYDALSLAAEQAGFATVRDEAGAKMTPEDLVVALWLDAGGQDLVRSVHARHCMANPRSFESFYPMDDAPDRLRCALRGPDLARRGRRRGLATHGRARLRRGDHGGGGRL